MNKENNPINFAIGSVKFAPNKKLNDIFKMLYKLLEGIIQYSQFPLFIESKQYLLNILWNIRLKVMKVNAHLQTLVVVVKG